MAERNNKNAKRRIAMRNTKRIKQLQAEMDTLKSAIWILQNRIELMELQESIKTMAQKIEAREIPNEKDPTELDIGEIFDLLIEKTNQNQTTGNITKEENKSPSNQAVEESQNIGEMDPTPLEEVETVHLNASPTENSKPKLEVPLPVAEKTPEIEEELGNWNQSYPFSDVRPGPYSKEFVEKILFVIRENG
eukprot:TRINITY_DN2849_c0_g1_i6.p1 TRINITY_DN2849_c0_g1~~TRINITY_DN2849_c0_g1_i6.p1  ORF type:complete len:192 (+),score=40.72 TRINITY_DN2849_c0_g1_i6:88-663(+)